MARTIQAFGADARLSLQGSDSERLDLGLAAAVGDD
jgi:hypothetical protein